MSDVQELLRRPAVMAAVRDLGVATLGVEDVLLALHRYGAVRIEVRENASHPYACRVLIAGETPETGHGSTVLHAALACWAQILDAFGHYAARGQDELERFLLGQGDAA
jgi:hypothetical protein